MKGKKLLALLLVVCIMISLIPAVPVTNATPTQQSEPKEINVLLIGNSYAADTVNYLAEIFESAGYTDFNIVSLYYSGATLSRIYEEMLLSELADTYGMGGHASGGIYYYNANPTFTYNDGSSITTHNGGRTYGNCFCRQKYTKTDGGAIQSHNTVYNYSLKEAVQEDDWDIISIQNINNSYATTVDAAWTALSAKSADIPGGANTYKCDNGDYSIKVSFGGTDYYAGGDYVGQNLMSVMTDWIVDTQQAAQSVNTPKVWFNATWVPDARNGKSNHSGRGIVNGDSQGKSAIYWEQELNTYAYKYTQSGSQTWGGATASQVSTVGGNKLTGWIPQNMLVQYLHQNLSNLSNTNRLWRDGTHLSDIGRYAVALNYFYNVTGTDFTDPDNRVEFVPDFEMAEHLDEIYEALTLANADILPEYVSVKYCSKTGGWENPYGDADTLTSQKTINNPWYLVGGKVELVYTAKFEGSGNNMANGKYGYTTAAGNADKLVPSIIETAELKNLLTAQGGTDLMLSILNIDATDVSAASAQIANIPTYITIDDYQTVTDIYNSVNISGLTTAQYDKLYATGELEKLLDAKRRVDTLKAENTHFFVDFDTNGSDTAETVVSNMTPSQYEELAKLHISTLENNANFKVLDLNEETGDDDNVVNVSELAANDIFWAIDPTTDSAYNSSTGDGYNGNYHMYRTGSAAAGFVYWPTLIYRQGNNYRRELMIRPDGSIENMVAATVYVRKNGENVGASSTPGTINGNSLSIPAIMSNENNQLYMTDGYSQLTSTLARPTFGFADGVLDGDGIYELNFKFVGNTGHVGRKLSFYTEYTDYKNYKGYIVNDTVLQPFTCVDGVITTGANVQATTVNYVKHTTDEKNGSENGVYGYHTGSNTFSMQYVQGAYEITIVSPNDYNRDNNKQKVVFHWRLAPSDMITDFHFSGYDGGKYFDNFEIKTVDVDSVNTYVNGLNINSITKSNDAVAIQSAYTEYLKVVDAGLTEELDEGVSEKITVAEYIISYLIANGANHVSAPEDIDALSLSYTVAQKSAYDTVIAEYDHFVNIGLDTIFTELQKDKVAVLKVAIANNADYDTTPIMNLIADIDAISQETPMNSMGFTSRVEAYRAKVTALTDAGYGDAVVNKSKLATVEANLQALNGKYIDASQLTFKDSNNAKYTEHNNDPGWNSSEMSGIVSMVDLYTGAGVESIKFTLPASYIQHDTEHMFIYDYQGLDEAGYEDFSGFGFYAFDYNREAWGYTVHRETEHAATFLLPTDCAYTPRNVYSYNVDNPTKPFGNSGLRSDDWAAKHASTGNSNGNANIIWYLAEENGAPNFENVTYNGNNVEANSVKSAKEKAIERLGAGTIQDLRLNPHSTVTVEMVYQGDANTVKGFNWYLVKVTGEFMWNYKAEGASSSSLVSAEAEVPAVYFRLFYNGRFKDIGVTHSVSDMPEDVLQIQEVSVVETVTEMTKGASVRLTENSNTAGIRFESNVNVSLYNAMKSLAENGYIQKVELGTLIAPNDYLTGIEFTVEGLTAAGKTYLDIPQTQWQDEAEGVYTAAMVNIRSENYARSFAGRGYMKVTNNDGTVEYYYSSFSSSNVRSIQYVATQANMDTALLATLTEGQKDILNLYAGVAE